MWNIQRLLSLSKKNEEIGALVTFTTLKQVTLKVFQRSLKSKCIHKQNQIREAQGKSEGEDYKTQNKNDAENEDGQTGRMKMDRTTLTTGNGKAPHADKKCHCLRARHWTLETFNVV